MGCVFDHHVTNDVPKKETYPRRDAGSRLRDPHARPCAGCQPGALVLRVINIFGMPPSVAQRVSQCVCEVVNDQCCAVCAE